MNKWNRGLWKIKLMADILNISEQELEWLIEGLDALILPDRSKRIKRALSRALKEIEDKTDG